MADAAAPQPDTPDDELAAELRLAMIPGVGPLLRQALLDRFASARAVFAASPEQLRNVPGIGPKLLGEICRAEQLDVAALVARCRSENILLLGQNQPAYPRLLREIPDPPGVLFVRGELVAQDALAIAIVGTRHGSNYGLRQAERLGASLARAGLTIVSGLARGIDAAAHRGALSAGGRTLAVLATGVSNIYPPEHDELACQVIDRGALLSESPPESAPVRGAFPRRNRLITGLSLGVIVVEAAERSGALISARHATEQNREVFAVPGRVDSRVSTGCHRLLRDGATLVESADDVLAQLGPLVEGAADPRGRTVHHPAELQLNDQEQAVLDAIGDEPTLLDAIVAATGFPAQRVMATVSVLEMRRLIERTAGGTVVRR